MSSRPNSTSLSLLDAVRRGHDAAWERMVELYHPLVYEHLRRCGLNEEDAEKLGHKVFVDVYRGIDGFRKEKTGDTFRSWVRGICRSKYIDWVRSNTESSCAVDGIDATLPPEDARAADSREASFVEKQILFRQAIRLIEAYYSERDVAAFRSIMFDGQSPADVARSLGVDVNVVHLAKSRILARLREEFVDVISDDTAV